MVDSRSLLSQLEALISETEALVGKLAETQAIGAGVPLTTQSDTTSDPNGSPPVDEAAQIPTTVVITVKPNKGYGWMAKRINEQMAPHPDWKPIKGKKLRKRMGGQMVYTKTYTFGVDELLGSGPLTGGVSGKALKTAKFAGRNWRAQKKAEKEAKAKAAAAAEAKAAAEADAAARNVDADERHAELFEMNAAAGQSRDESTSDSPRTTTTEGQGEQTSVVVTSAESRGGESDPLADGLKVIGAATDAQTIAEAVPSVLTQSPSVLKPPAAPGAFQYTGAFGAAVSLGTGVNKMVDPDHQEDALHQFDGVSDVAAGSFAASAAATANPVGLAVATGIIVGKAIDEALGISDGVGELARSPKEPSRPARTLAEMDEHKRILDQQPGGSVTFDKPAEGGLGANKATVYFARKRAQRITEKAEAKAKAQRQEEERQRSQDAIVNANSAVNKTPDGVASVGTDDESLKRPSKSRFPNKGDIDSVVPEIRTTKK